MVGIKRLSNLSKALESGERGLYFDIPGTKLKAAIMKKIAECKKRAEEKAKKNGIVLSKLKSDNDGLPVFESPSDVSNTIRYQLQNAKRLEAIARNLKTDATYRLGSYDLQEYGL